MGWHWSCAYEKGWGPWSDPDYEKCGAHSRKAFKTQGLAQKAAIKHLNRTGHSVSVGPDSRTRAALRRKRRK